VNSVLQDVVDCAIAAGAAIQEVAGRIDRSVTTKAGGDPVTAADHASDALLRERLPRIVPAAWLSEETADDRARLGATDVWIVDPLDGTKEFVEGVPQYAVSIALVRDGAPVIGVIHNPSSKEWFAAARGEGAFASPGARTRVAEGTTMLASRSEMRAGEFEAFTDWKTEAIGSIAFKLALIASGRGAVTLSRGPKWEWDVAAGALLVEEAGGFAGDVLGSRFTLNQEFPKVRGVLAGAPNAARAALDRIRAVGVSVRMAELG
jgi:myo-inositol-1(or 4)-monophosphatase